MKQLVAAALYLSELNDQGLVHGMLEPNNVMVAIGII